VSYNGSGTFNINTAGQPVVTGTVISSTAFNALTADLGTGLSTAITKDGQTVATARIPFASGISGPSVTNTAGVAVQGTNTNDSAAAGYVGEVQTSSVAVGSAVSLTTATGAFTGKTITSISLTAGDWDVFGIVGINNAATTNFTAIAGGISTTNDTLNGLYEEETRFAYGAAGLVPNNVISFTFPTTRVSIAATTTYYLIGYAAFSISTATAFGRITARRVR
jgi:hypothetical protein